MSDDTRTEAERDIRNLLARLAHLADDGNVETYVQLWAEEGSWYHPHYGEMSGRAAIRESLQKRLAAGGQGPGSHMRHAINTQWVRFEDDDHAFSQAYWFTMRVEGRPALSNAGRYDDELRRTPEGWKLFRRNITIDTD